MKGKIKQEISINDKDLIKSEYLILGVDLNCYYVLDESNKVNYIIKDQIEITDNDQPSFWIEDNGRLVPEEWQWNNFLQLNDDITDEWDEIWFITQFAKGLSKFNLSEIPSNFQKANDVEYKIGLIKNYLKIASDYDNLADDYITWRYEFGYFNDEIKCFRWINGEPQYFKKVLMSTNRCGFDILKELLEQIGSPFENTKLKLDKDGLDVIRNRILFSIWSIFGTKQFEVYELVFDHHQQADYVISYNSQNYLLSFDYFT